MDFGQILMIIAILGFIDSILAMIFPKAYVNVCKALKLSWWKNAEMIKKVAYWEFFIAIVLFVIGMNI